VGWWSVSAYEPDLRSVSGRRCRIASANDLRKLGATVTDVLCVIDRESGGAASLAAAGIALHSIFTKTDLTLAAAGSRARGSDERPYNDRGSRQAT
jgi:orotate phosphoribosyltransferase